MYACCESEGGGKEKIIEKKIVKVGRKRTMLRGKIKIESSNPANDDHTQTYTQVTMTLAQNLISKKKCLK